MPINHQLARRAARHGRQRYEVFLPTARPKNFVSYHPPFQQGLNLAIRRLNQCLPGYVQVDYEVSETDSNPGLEAGTNRPLVSRGYQSGTDHYRIVLYRRPILLLARNRATLFNLLYTICLEQISDLLNLDPVQLDPTYQSYF